MKYLTFHAIYQSNKLKLNKSNTELEIITLQKEKDLTDDEAYDLVCSTMQHLERVMSGYKLIKVISHTTDSAKYPGIVQA